MIIETVIHEGVRGSITGSIVAESGGSHRAGNEGGVQLLLMDYVLSFVHLVIFIITDN